MIKFNFNRFLWALRKLNLQIERDEIVLDVGSGGFPYPRADVLLDRRGGKLHRNNFKLKIDRPTIFADANKMPLKDSSIDYTIASHILEHMSNPTDFLNELTRISKRGYIETPSALFERLYPYVIHCNEIDIVDDYLIINKKRQPIIDQYLYEFKYLSSPKLGLGKIMHEYPELFHVRYFWDKAIKYKVVNEEINCDWIENIYLNEDDVSADEVSNYLSKSITWRNFGLQIINKFYSVLRAKSRNVNNLKNILCCPNCKSDLEWGSSSMSCHSCNIYFQYGELYFDFENVYPL